MPRCRTVPGLLPLCADTSEKVMFVKVLVGVDGLQGGRDAVALARILVAAAGEITLAHVYGGV